MSSARLVLTSGGINSKAKENRAKECGETPLLCRFLLRFLYHIVFGLFAFGFLFAPTRFCYRKMRPTCRMRDALIVMHDLQGRHFVLVAAAVAC